MNDDERKALRALAEVIADALRQRSSDYMAIARDYYGVTEEDQMQILKECGYKEPNADDLEKAMYGVLSN